MKSVISAFFLFSALCSCMAQEKFEVFFEFNKSDLNPTSLTLLNDWIVKHPTSKILKIYGFCDWEGSYGYNDSLSLRRVRTVFEYLTQQNIQVDKAYLEKGFGKNFIQDKNQAYNRKVEITYSNAAALIINESKEVSLSERVKIAKKGDKIILKNINFYNNSAQIVPKSTLVLDELLLVMLDNPNLKIEIQGHICCQSTKSTDDISTARAEAIYHHLIQNKIQPSRLIYKGYGTSNPIYLIPEKSNFEENENRRVEIKILDTKP